MGSYTPGHKRRTSNLAVGAVCGRSTLLSAVLGASVIVSILWLLGFVGGAAEQGKAPRYGTAVIHADTDSETGRHEAETEVRPDLAYVAKRKYNVAITERWNDHDEVLGSILYAFSQMPEVNVRLYRSAMRWDFDKIITSFWNTKELPYQQIHEDLPLEDDADTRIDLLIMTSLDFTLPYEGQKFMDAWDNRTRKFRMAGFIHEAYSIDDENTRKLWDELIARDTTDFYTLSPHVIRKTQEYYTNFRRPGWPLPNEWLPANMEYLVPVFPVPHLAEHKPERRLSRVVIQGAYEAHRRRYNATFYELIAEMCKDPELFGYMLIENGTLFVPMPDVPDRFKLILLGIDRGGVQLPNILSNVVVRMIGEAYPDYYTAMTSFDMILPAFEGTDYTTIKASSSMPAGALSNIPIMISDDEHMEYQYLDDRISVRRSSWQHEMEVVASLRRHDPARWRKSAENFASFRQEHYERNIRIYRETLERVRDWP